jgi:hypothetical protein
MENGTHGRLYVHPAAAGEVFPFPGLINGGTQKLFISWNFLLIWMIQGVIFPFLRKLPFVWILCQLKLEKVGKQEFLSCRVRGKSFAAA